MLETPFTQLVGCRVPIQQAPMGGISTPDLAVAVAEAGGVGTISSLGLSAGQLDTMLADIAGRTSGVVAANFLTRDVDRDAVAAASARVRLVDFFWNDPDPSLVEIAHRGGALASWQVGSLEEARAAAEAGCDVVVVQGTEAGGHVRGESRLMPLLEAAVARIDIPVLAAGAIADGRSLAAVLSAGAAGARIGTRFIATEESGAHPAYKQAIVEASAGSTEITGAFNVCPLCATQPTARVLRASIDALGKVSTDIVGEAVIAGRMVPVPKGSGMPPAAYSSGEIGAMAMYASDAVAAVQGIEPVAKVIADMCATAEREVASVR